MVYYRIKEDINFPHRWYLGNILNDKDNWKFTYGNYLVPSCGYKVDVYRNGDAMDYTTTEVYCVPIISERTKKVFQKYQKVQFFDAEINNIEGMYSIFNITEVIDCVGENNSDFEKFEVNDPIRPDLDDNSSQAALLVVTNDDGFSWMLSNQKQGNQVVLDFFLVEKRGNATKSLSDLFSLKVRDTEKEHFFGKIKSEVWQNELHQFVKDLV